MKGENKILKGCSLSIMDELENSPEKDDKIQCTDVFLDEEAVFNVPGFLDRMAEGLCVTPPSMRRAMNWDETDFCEDMDLTLWSD